MTPESALYQLMLSLFEADALRNWLRFDTKASVIVHDLPGSTASKSALASAAVDRLVEHGLVDRGLFARLRDARPDRAAEIDQVAGLWRSANHSGAVDASTAASARSTTAAQGSNVSQSGGFFAPGSTFNVQGGQYAGDKHEVHHHYHGVAPPVGREPAELLDRARLRPGAALEITPLEPPAQAIAFWPAGEPQSDGLHAEVVEDSGDRLVIRMHALAFGGYVVGVQGDQVYEEHDRTPADVELRIPAAEIESIAPSLQGDSFELHLSRPLRYEPRTRRWVLGAPGSVRPSMSPVSPSQTSPVGAAPRVGAPSVRPASEQVLTAWVHVSDIHFGHGKPSHQWDQQLITADILRDLREVLRGGATPTPRHVFVTGDIAFSGGGRRPVAGSSEYQLAATWLDGLAEVLGLGRDQVFLVPGNHDVDRGVERADRDVRRLLQLARAGTEPLDELLQHDEDVARLQQRMAAFVDFARSFGPAARKDFHGGLWWRHSVALAEGVRLRICGFNTGLLSADDEDQGKLAVSARQLAELLLPPPDELELVVALSHHPLTGKWVSDEAAARGRLDREAAIHLFGHLHDPDSEQARHGWGTGCLRIAAGATHAEAAKPGEPPIGHGYGLGALVALPSGELVVRIWPRRWSSKSTRFVPDVDNIDEVKGYAEHRLRQRISRQTRPSGGAMRRSVASAALPTRSTSAGPVQEPQASKAPVSGPPTTSLAATENEPPSRVDGGERRRSWDAVGVVTKILADAPRWLAEALDRGVPGAQRGARGESHAELARRVAGNIDALGAGIEAAGILIRGCDDALFPEDGDPEPDVDVARHAVRKLLCEWMPRRYDDGAAVERSSHAECPDLRLSTASELVAAFHVAGENDLAAEIDGNRLRSKRSLEEPAALAAEMHGDDLADRIAEDVLGKEPEIARQGQDTPADRRDLVAGRFARLHRRKKPRDLTLSSATWARLATPQARARLKQIFEMLRQVETTASSAEEKALREILIDIFRDEDDD
ncbi:MAG: metallophosphoesterase [Myxococcales bacterium]|nr:metallophosphoesterase [Myxococcales bacterium]